MQEPQVSDRPALSWVAVRDADGRVRMEAHWGLPVPVAGMPPVTTVVTHAA